MARLSAVGIVLPRPPWQREDQVPQRNGLGMEERVEDHRRAVVRHRTQRRDLRDEVEPIGPENTQRFGHVPPEREAEAQRPTGEDGVGGQVGIVSALHQLASEPDVVLGGVGGELEDVHGVVEHPGRGRIERASHGVGPGTSRIHQVERQPGHVRQHPLLFQGKVRLQVPLVAACPRVMVAKEIAST